MSDMRCQFSVILTADEVMHRLTFQPVRPANAGPIVVQKQLQEKLDSAGKRALWEQMFSRALKECDHI